MNRIVLMLLTSVLLNTIAQLSLKRGVMTLRVGQPQPSGLVFLVSRACSNPFILLWAGLLVPSLLLWIKAISMTDLSFAYPFLSLSLVLISLGSILFLKERVSFRQWTGIALILLGILSISYS